MRVFAAVIIVTIAIYRENSSYKWSSTTTAPIVISLDITATTYLGAAVENERFSAPAPSLYLVRFSVRVFSGRFMAFGDRGKMSDDRITLYRGGLFVDPTGTRRPAVTITSFRDFSTDSLAFVTPPRQRLSSSWRRTEIQNRLATLPFGFSHTGTVRYHNYILCLEFLRRVLVIILI